MNISQHIEDMNKTLSLKSEQRRSLLNASVSEGRSLDQSEADDFDELQTAITQLNEDIARFEKMEIDEMKNARTVNKAPSIIRNRTREEDFEGQNFTRMVIAKAIARENGTTALAVAQKRWGSNRQLIDVIKADVAGMGSGSGESGSELVAYNAYMQDFIDYLHGKTVYNQLALEEVPANIIIGEQDGAATGYWVGESKAIPVSSADFNAVSLGPLKVAALAVASKEWLRDSSWSAERLVRNALVNASSRRIDETFLSSAAAVSNVSPAGILNGISATSSAGTDSDAIANDFKELMYSFTAAKNSGGQAVVMSPHLATSISMMRGALGQFEFPDISEDGGRIFGKTVYTGDNVNSNHVIMLKPSDIYKIGAGTVEVSMNDAATIEMANNPAMDTDTPTAATGKMVSMYQTESVAFKVVMPMNFARRRESAVAYISDADYGGTISV